MSTTRPARAILGCSAGLLAIGLVLTAPVVAHQAVDPAVLRLVKPRLGPLPTGIDRRPGTALVEQGRKLFFGETFGGNGRTCGTCHRAERNLTIDAEFIARLPNSDPLFVGERPPLIGLENPVLMRTRGLILENLDGFSFKRPGVLRGVPHTLGLGLSTGPAVGVPLKGATGWSGDGAPGDGTLKQFAVGAVVQHFTKTLDRIASLDGGRTGDFVVPTDAQLNALVAFQLSTGRQSETKVNPNDPDRLRFLDDTVTAGQRLFHGLDPDPGITRDLRSCAFCHVDAGATRANTSPPQGANFDTGTRLVDNAPACFATDPYPRAPVDGGLGFAETSVTLCGQTLSYGDGTINTPSIVEAADTTPLFHNNTAATIEDAVGFYTTDAFAASPAGRAGGAFALKPDEVTAVAAFLRALNALDNIASANRSLEGAIGRPSFRTLLKDPAVRDINDAIKVITRGPVRLFAETRPVPSLIAAVANIARGRLPVAQQDLERARRALIDIKP